MEYGKTLLILLLVIAIYIMLDIYYRLRSIRRYIRLLLLTNDVVNKTLVSKGLIKREELDQARKDVLEKMYVGDYDKLKKDLIKIGINVDK